MERFRTIIHSPRFTSELQRICGDAERAEEFLEGFEFEVARDPHMVGTPSKGNPAIWVSGSREAWVGPLKVYYAFSEDNVELISITKDSE